MYIYIHIHTSMHVYMYTCTYIYVYVYIYICRYEQILTKMPAASSDPGSGSRGGLGSRERPSRPPAKSLEDSAPALAARLSRSKNPFSVQGPLFWQFKGGFKVSSGTV